MVHALLAPEGTHGRLRTLLTVLPLVGVLGVVPLWWTSERLYYGVVGEDRLAEWLTFMVYLPTAVIAVVVARRLAGVGLRLESALFLVLAVAAFGVAGEEISWGQRVFGFAGPEALVERNVQQEANVHNLLGPLALHLSFVVAAAYGTFAAAPLVARLPRLRERPWLFVPQRDLAPWFGICFAYYAWTVAVDPVLVAAFGDGAGVDHWVGSKLQEPAELAMAVGVLLFVARLAARQDVHQPATTAPPLTQAAERPPRA